MYICVLSSVPEDPNDKPYDPSPHMNGFKWKHHRVDPAEVEKQMRDLVNEGVDREVEVALRQTYAISPATRAAVKAIPGVIDVQEI